MFKKKNKQIKTAPNKSNLEQVLWFIEKLFAPKERSRCSKKIVYR